MLGEIPYVQLSDEKVNRMQGNIIEKVNRVLKVPFLDGVLLKDVVLANGNNEISHGLRRVYTGYLILIQNASAGFFANPTGTTDREQILRLNSSAAVTVDLWVF